MWQIGIYFCWGIFAVGGILMAELPGNGAGIGVAAVGLIGLGLQYYFKDRSEERLMKVSQLIAENKELKEGLKKIATDTQAEGLKVDRLIKGLGDTGQFVVPPEIKRPTV